MPERILNWLLRTAGSNWVMIVLLGGLVSAVTASVDRADWVREDQGLIATFLVGIALGWLLSRSSYGGWFAAFYSVTMSFLAAVEAAADIVPPLRQLVTTPFLELANALNLRAFEFYLRLENWIETLRAGENIEDTGLFVLLFGFILALCGGWLMWTLLRQRRVLHGLLPLGILLAINVHLSRQPLLNYWIFLFCAVLLVARTAYSRTHEDWQRRAVDYPEQLGIEWAMAALAAAFVIALVARAGPLVGTPQGWQAISEWLSERQEQTSDTAERLFSGVNTPPPPPPPIDLTPQIFVNPPSMGVIGNPIAQGSLTIMWVTISDPPPVPLEAPINVQVQNRVILHYWRSSIYSRYTGRGWELVPVMEEAVPQPEDQVQAAEGRYLLRQDFEMVAQHSGELFATNDPVQTTAGLSLRATLPDGSRLVQGQEDVYSVISQATRVTANQLDAAPAAYPEEIALEYLQLPEGLPARVGQLARRVAGSAANPYQQALNLQAYLRENFPYDLSVRTPPEGRDAVDYFLFEDQRGSCSHYASAMAVMLRELDVPARVATGYAMGEYNYEQAAYRVPLSAAHAWVEVYFPGYGWIEFEPTAYRSPIEYPEESSGLSGPQVSIDAVEPPPALPQPILTALVIAAGLVLLALPFVVLRMFTAPRQAPSVQVGVLYRRMRRALAWAGLVASPSITPDEYLAQYGGQLDRYHQLQQALRQATHLYRESVYSPRAPDAARVRTASQFWQQSLGEWLVLWLRAYWKRLRGQPPPPGLP